MPETSKVVELSLKVDAVGWANENGLKWPVDAFAFGQTAYGGFCVTVSDQTGRQAHCYYKPDGSRDMYERTDRLA